MDYYVPIFISYTLGIKHILNKIIKYERNTKCNVCSEESNEYIGTCCRKCFNNSHIN